MKNSRFNFAEEFAQAADVVRMGAADDVRISYAVFVGSADENCIGVGRPFDDVFFSADDFTTWGDAAKARQLAIVTLRQVDKNLAQGLNLADVRAEVLAAISLAFSRADEKGCAVSKQEVLRAADSCFGYYARNED